MLGITRGKLDNSVKESDLSNNNDNIYSRPQTYNSNLGAILSSYTPQVIVEERAMDT